MKMGMNITYEVDSGLYVNVTNRCSNSCEFCIRGNGDGAYGSDTLWLTREPTLDEIKADVDSRDLSKYSEVVFCGYGEPSYRLNDIREVALYIKEKMPGMRVRINTNGHSDLIWQKNTAPDYEGAFDTVSISLNTPTAEKYQKICHSIYGESSFDALLSFAGRVKNYVPSVQLSAVKETLTEEEIELCRKISIDLGVTLRLRDYIPPES